MRRLTLFAVIFLVGCGSAGTGTNSSDNNATIQQGQWELAITPSQGSGSLFYIEANLAKVAGSAALPDQYQAPNLSALFALSNPDQFGSFACRSNMYVSTSITGTVLSGQVNGSDDAFSGTVSAGGKSLSNALFSGSLACSINFAYSSVPMTATFIPPLTGTFAGNITDTYGNVAAVSITLQQDSHFNLSGNGTLQTPGVTTTLSINPGGAPIGPGGTDMYPNVVGTLLQVTGTVSNVNGTDPFFATGRFNASGTSITLGYFDQSTSIESTGTLTKQ